MSSTQKDPKDNLKYKEKVPTISYFSIFSFSTTGERIMMVIASFFSMAAGAALPLFSLVFGNLTNSLAPPGDASSYNPNIVDQASEFASYFVYIGIGTFVSNFISMAVFLSISEKVSGRIRKAYFDALTKQEIGWFDMLNPNELASKVAMETFTVQQGVGEKIPAFLMAFCTIIAGFAMGFIRGWELSLVLCGAIPFMSVAGGLFAWVLTNIKKLTNNAYIHASAYAEQALNAIKTVKSLSSEDFELNTFSIELKKAVKITIKNGLVIGFSIGFLYFCFMSDYGLGFWFGSITIEKQWYNSIADRAYNVGDVITVFFCITMGSMFLAQIPPPIKAFLAARESASQIFYVLNRTPKIINNDVTKKECKEIKGDIVFKDVDFSYPARMETQVLKKVNVTIQKGKKTAFVGESGSGKSTIVALIERFYDPTEGKIILDDIDLKDYNLMSLRRYIGYVGQEPVLFSGSIRDNLFFGKEDATEDEMYNALKQANALDFVNNLQNKLDTFIGIGGNQLSGGQKQRIAIARAILKNPPILLLDEATSALDRTNEMAIQKTLDDISGGKTTIVIAHRLSTIQDADRIYVMANGIVDSFGTHEELLEKHGKYEALVKIQLTQKDQENPEKKNEDEDLAEIPILTVKKLSRKYSGLKEEEINLKDPVTMRESQLKGEAANIKKTELNKKTKQIYKRIFREYIRPHFLIFSLAVLGSIFNGGVQPTMAILMGEIMQSLALYTEPDFRERVDLLSGMFVVIGVAALIGNVLQSYFFSILAEQITYELKVQAYHRIMRKPMFFFDDPNNNPGILSSRVSIDTQEFNGLIASYIGIIIQGISGFATGMIIAFIYSWQLTLVALGLSPLISIGQAMMGKVMSGFVLTDEIYKQSGAIIMETVVNIRTVASFCNEKMLVQKYYKQIEKPISVGTKKGISTGFTFGLSYFLLFVFYALVFYIAAHLQDKEGLTLKEFFIALFAIIMAAGGTGAASNFLPDLGQGVIAADNVFQLLDSKDQENYDKPGVLPNEISGNIVIRNLYFKYPSREKYIFQGFNLEIPAGKKIAFVGPSGCGKSTLFQLLMRFYEIEKGEILIDGVDIRSLDVKQLRSLYGVVSQEPVLFQGTVGYNIKYNSNASTEEVRKAAGQANALSFIEANQFDVIDTNNKNENHGVGFEREVGSKGSQISGGQKQRLAIARAIIKKPKILLLDEATSALDAQNENIVQESLNNIMKNKTSLVIAHRISTIKDADEILVFGEGRIVERGIYEDLVRSQGVFYKFERGFSN